MKDDAPSFQLWDQKSFLPRPTSNDRNPAISVIIPCFNDVEVIEETHRRCAKVMQDLFGQRYELVLVNDGSRDGTWSEIVRAAEGNPHVVGVNLSRNFGHQSALLSGFQIAAGELIFVLDSDLQDPPELLPQMLQVLEQGADVVYGERRDRPGETVVARTGASIFYRLLRKLSPVDIPANTGEFRLMRRKVLDALLQMPESTLFIRGMISWLGFRQVAFEYDRDPRFAGTTSYSLVRRVRLAIVGITSFSIAPLRFAFGMALMFALASVAMLVWVIYVKIHYDILQGWASIMLTISVIAAAQFLILGTIGEYLGKLFIESKGRPRFVVQDIVRFPNDGRNSTATLS